MKLNLVKQALGLQILAKSAVKFRMKQYFSDPAECSLASSVTFPS